MFVRLNSCAGYTSMRGVKFPAIVRGEFGGPFVMVFGSEIKRVGGDEDIVDDFLFVLPEDCCEHAGCYFFSVLISPTLKNQSGVEILGEDSPAFNIDAPLIYEAKSKYGFAGYIDDVCVMDDNGREWGVILGENGNVSVVDDSTGNEILFEVVKP